jgi:hypothetical protein
MTSTSFVLIQAVTQNPGYPHTIAVEKGKEFVGHPFQEIPKDNSICDHCSHSYTPQEMAGSGACGRPLKTLSGTEFGLAPVGINRNGWNTKNSRWSLSKPCNIKVQEKDLKSFPSRFGPLLHSAHASVSKQQLSVRMFSVALMYCKVYRDLRYESVWAIHRRDLKSW